MPSQHEFLAVLTGDIAGSSDLPDDLRARLPAALRDVSASVREHFPDAVSHPIDIFRGDSWQILAREPALALRIALHMRASLHAKFEGARVDTRVAIGIGTVDFVPDTDISGGNGEAFRLSGTALDEMGRTFRMAFAASDDLPHVVGDLIDACVKLIDVIAMSWTQRQAFAIAHALLGLTQEEIGAAWINRPISQQSVAQHLSSAGWAGIEHALAVSEAALSRGHTLLSL